jgi:hypothetical protein
VTEAEASSPPAARVDTTNNNTDWTKKKQSRTSLVHDIGLTNGQPSKRHATLPTGGGQHANVGGEHVAELDRHDVAGNEGLAMQSFTLSFDFRLNGGTSIDFVPSSVVAGERKQLRRGL